MNLKVRKSRLPQYCTFLNGAMGEEETERDYAGERGGREEWTRHTKKDTVNRKTKHIGGTGDACARISLRGYAQIYKKYLMMMMMVNWFNYGNARSNKKTKTDKFGGRFTAS